MNWNILVILAILPAFSAFPAEYGFDKTADETVSSPPPENGVAVVYFHGTIRCFACLEIERLAREAVGEMIASSLGDGNIAWNSIDYDQTQNVHYIQRYNLSLPTLVVSLFQNGREKDWKLLNKTWDLLEEDPEALKAYVQREVREMVNREL